MCGGFEVEAGPHPDNACAITDPGGLEYLTTRGPPGAWGASGEIYKFLHVDGLPAFPAEVRSACTQTGDVCVKSYPMCGCIHVASPDFSGDKGGVTKADVVAKLAGTYQGIFAAFAKCTTLHILLVSSSRHAGKFWEGMHEITGEALKCAEHALNDDVIEQIVGKGKSILMCMCEEKYFEKYEVALNFWFQVDKADVGPTPPPTLLFEDGFEPITHMWEYQEKVGFIIADSTGKREVDDGSAQLSGRLSTPIYIYSVPGAFDVPIKSCASVAAVFWGQHRNCLNEFHFHLSPPEDSLCDPNYFKHTTRALTWARGGGRWLTCHAHDHATGRCSSCHAWGIHAKSS